MKIARTLVLVIILAIAMSGNAQIGTSSGAGEAHHGPHGPDEAEFAARILEERTEEFQIHIEKLVKGVQENWRKCFKNSSPLTGGVIEVYKKLYDLKLLDNLNKLNSVQKCDKGCDESINGVKPSQKNEEKNNISCLIRNKEQRHLNKILKNKKFYETNFIGGYFDTLAKQQELIKFLQLLSDEAKEK